MTYLNIEEGLVDKHLIISVLSLNTIFGIVRFFQKSASLIGKPLKNNKMIRLNLKIGHALVPMIILLVLALKLQFNDNHKLNGIATLCSIYVL